MSTIKPKNERIFDKTVSVELTLKEIEELQRLIAIKLDGIKSEKQLLFPELCSVDGKLDEARIKLLGLY